MSSSYETDWSEDYSDFVRSFMSIQDSRIRQVVGEELTRGFLWPEPLIQLNPAFESGERIDELVSLGILHPECRKVFVKDKDASSGGRPLRLHRHQAEAIKVAREGHNYVLTTGTGSGKSLAYIVPIVDHVLRRGSGRGIQAIVVYPMNALANSQMGELHKFLCVGYPDEKGPGNLCPLYRPGEGRRASGHHRQSAGYPAHQLRHAGVASDPSR